MFSKLLYSDDVCVEDCEGAEDGDEYGGGDARDVAFG